MEGSISINISFSTTSEIPKMIQTVPQGHLYVQHGTQTMMHLLLWLLGLPEIKQHCFFHVLFHFTDSNEKQKW